MDTKQFDGHTPGPWVVHKVSRIRIVAPLIHVISTDIQGRTQPEAQANARLIAAAPDLLAENKRLRAALEGVIRVADRDTDEFNAARDALSGDV